MFLNFDSNIGGRLSQSLDRFLLAVSSCAAQKKPKTDLTYILKTFLHVWMLEGGGHVLTVSDSQAVGKHRDGSNVSSCPLLFFVYNGLK